MDLDVVLTRRVYERGFKKLHNLFTNDWADGFSTLKQPFFLSTHWIEFDNKIFKGDRKQTTSPFIYMYGFIKEVIENIDVLGKIKINSFDY